MKYITFKFLEENNFQFHGLSNIPIKDQCITCNKEFEYKKLKKFIKNRLSLPKDTWCKCQKCFLLSRTIYNQEWIEKNRKAQLIAQNKPEQKRKNALHVSKSWNSKRRNQASKLMKRKWKTDKNFAKKAINNLKQSKEHARRSFGQGGLKGYYKNIYYDSALELSYIIWCEDNNIPIRRYDLDPIPYYDFDKKIRLYFPDFIIYEDQIVEIKGRGLYFGKNKNRNLAKTKEAKKILLDKFIIIFDNDKEVKTNYKKARRIHHEIKK